LDYGERLQALEARLQAAEDQLEILALLNTYGPMVDSGEGEAASKLWVEGGGYSFSGGVSGGTRLEAPSQLVEMYKSDAHMNLVNTGSAHFTGTPRIVMKGDTAEAVGYSFVVLREGDRWYLWRAAVNEWQLKRTPQGWRVVERINRTLNGTDESHDLMRKVMS
jgi:hypothetical protein